MPPLKEALPRNFSREASGILTRIGHGRLLVIVDTSFDIPDDVNPIYYLGNKQGNQSSAATLIDLARSCPIDEDKPVRYMMPDLGAEGDFPAPTENEETIKRLGLRAQGVVKDGRDGFYAQSRGDNPAQPPVYILNASEFAYDCIIATVGHSQK